MKIISAADYQDMSRKAANIIAAQVTLKPDSVLGLATGSTPVGMYKELVRRHQAGDLDFSRVKSVNLDEYAGLAPTHDQSYRYFMQLNLFDHINIDPKNTHVPNGLAEDRTAECRRYDRVIRELGGADIQVLGMGHNGHIAFNEPGDVFVPETHLVALAESTIQANARFFASADEVPRQAMTMGIGGIMSARHILLLVSGGEKAETLKKALTGPVDPHIPASVLRLHPQVTLVADQAALREM